MPWRLTVVPYVVREVKAACDRKVTVGLKFVRQLPWKMQRYTSAQTARCSPCVRGCTQRLQMVGMLKCTPNMLPPTHSELVSFIDAPFVHNKIAVSEAAHTQQLHSTIVSLAKCELKLAVEVHSKISDSANDKDTKANLVSFALVCFVLANVPRRMPIMVQHRKKGSMVL